MPKRKYPSAKQVYLSASESEEEPEYIRPGPSRRRNKIVHESEPDVDVEGDVDMEAASAAASDPEPEDEDEDDEIVDLEPEEEEEDQQDDDAEAEEEEEEELDPEQEDEDEQEQQPMPAQPRLRIKLKIPSYTPSGSATPALDEEEQQSVEDDDEEVTQSKRLTSRQAAMAAGVDVSHVSLGDGPRKKKALNETELALRREETARKRKNLSEKKLEDEKMETINRLLKKQTRTRNSKRSVPTPSEDRGTPGAGDESDSGQPNSEATPPPAPTMYRWVSSSAVVDGQRCTEVRFSVPFDPESALNGSGSGGTPSSNGSGEEERRTGVSEVPAPQVVPLPRKGCAVSGCEGTMKYRLPERFWQGACGMAHLKVLKSIPG